MELEFIEWLSKNLPAQDLPVGFGDDAAVLRWGSEPGVVVTTDALTDGVDFILGDVDPRQIGHKALAVNLSDLAAMAAEPVSAVVSLILPKSPPVEPPNSINAAAGVQHGAGVQLAQQIYQGILPLAQRHRVSIAGGDTNTWDNPLVISITAIGRTTARGPLTRSGALPGDQLLVTGALGGSILGRHLQVEPRVDESLQLHRDYELHAGIDLSDGLALDASRVAESSHCGVVIDLPQVPASPAACAFAKTTGKTPVHHALSDGEDFELLFAAPPDAAAAILADQPLDIPITRIGEFVEGGGLFQRDATGKVSPLEPTGFRH